MDFTNDKLELLAEAIMGKFNESQKVQNTFNPNLLKDQQNAKHKAELEAAKKAFVAAQAKVKQLENAKTEADAKLQSAQNAPGLSC